MDSRNRVSLHEIIARGSLAWTSAHWHTICAMQLERWGASSTLMPLTRSSSIDSWNLHWQGSIGGVGRNDEG